MSKQQNQIKLFNSISKSKENFVPNQAGKVTMYVCGPTVYERPHIGNARSVVIYDLWFRLFKAQFQEVVYVRNITDVDDKINKAAKEQGVAIGQLTKKIIGYFESDMEKLQVLRPTIEPKATQNIEKMIEMIEKLIENGFAYVNQGHVLFDVNSYKQYGQLSNRSLDDMIAGSRVEVADYKRNPLDFVLWKPADEDDDISSIFDSPWSKGRPGWHIECSAMSAKYLGMNFDIHGGGADLQFPHHENEIAQSKCAYQGSKHAKYWIHNGFLTVNGEKMSKSLKNFILLHDLLEDGVSGVVIRYLLLSSHYRKPLDFNEKGLNDAKKSIDKFYSAIAEANVDNTVDQIQPNPFLNQVIAALSDDLNTPKAFAVLHELVKIIKHEQGAKKDALVAQLVSCLDFFGLYDEEYLQALNEAADSASAELTVDEAYILEQIELRKQAKIDKNYQLADEIRNNLLSKNGIILEDVAGGQTIWKKA